MTEHALKSSKKEERVHIVTCACGDSFDSMESEALARYYLATHIRIKAKAAQR